MTPSYHRTELPQMPFRTAKMTKDQLDEFVRTGQFPKGVQVIARDDMGRALNEPIDDTVTMCEKASELATTALTRIEEQALLNRAKDMISDFIVAVKANDTKAMAEGLCRGFQDSFKYGYACAALDAMKGTLK